MLLAVRVGVGPEAMLGLPERCLQRLERVENVALRERGLDLLLAVRNAKSY